jgi:hypothetical protein
MSIHEGPRAEDSVARAVYAAIEAGADTVRAMADHLDGDLGLLAVRVAQMRQAGLLIVRTGNDGVAHHAIPEKQGGAQ